MSWINEIVDGWRNDIIPPKDLKESINKMSEERMVICRACPLDSLNKGISSLVRGEYCTKCGCPLHKKTKSPTSKCPLDPPKWDSYMSIQDYQKLTTQS